MFCKELQDFSRERGIWHLVTILGHTRKLDKTWTSGSSLKVPDKDFNCSKQLNHVGGSGGWEMGTFCLCN